MSPAETGCITAEEGWCSLWRRINASCIHMFAEGEGEREREEVTYFTSQWTKFTVFGRGNCIFQHLFRSSAPPTEINMVGLLFCVFTIYLGKDSANVHIFTNCSHRCSSRTPESHDCKDNTLGNMERNSTKQPLLSVVGFEHLLPPWIYSGSANTSIWHTHTFTRLCTYTHEKWNFHIHGCLAFKVWVLHPVT